MEQLEQRVETLIEEAPVCFITYIDREGYFSTRQSFGAEYINTLGNIMQPWTAPVLIVAAFVCGMLGALLGKALLKKHFVKAGIV